MALEQYQQEALQKLVGVDVHFHEPLAKYTTMRVGGPADALVMPKAVDVLLELIKFAKAEDLPWLILGRGSNLLVRDGGVRGLVINLQQLDALRLDDKCGAEGVRTTDDGRRTTVLYAEAGVKLRRLLGFCAEHGLSGLEGLEGVPGTVGGAIVMNAGTPAGDIGSAVVDVTCIEQGTRIVTKTAAQLDFAYRQSKLARTAIVLSARLMLQSSSPEAVRARLLELRTKREQSQPGTQPGAGSIFRNPKGRSAWRMIEEAGLRGVRIGQARISDQHTNWIINEGDASAKDVETLIKLMRDKVKERCGMLLETEVIIVGEE